MYFIYTLIYLQIIVTKRSQILFFFGCIKKYRKYFEKISIFDIQIE